MKTIKKKKKDIGVECYKNPNKPQNTPILEMSPIHSFTKYFLLTHHKSSQKNNWKDIRLYLFFFLKYCFRNLPEGRKIK